MRKMVFANEGMSPRELLAEMRDNPVFRRISKVCEKNGYELLEASQREAPSGMVASIEIRPRGGNGDLPQIFCNQPRPSAPLEVEINCSSFRTSDTGEFQRYLGGLEGALEVAEYVKKADLDMLWVYPRE